MLAYLWPFFTLSTLTLLEDANRLKSFLKNKYFYSFIALFLHFIYWVKIRDWMRLVKI